MIGGIPMIVPEALHDRRTFLSALAALALACVAPARAVRAGSATAPAAEDPTDPDAAARGELVLRIDGVASRLALDALNHNEVEAGTKTPDSFEFAGPGLLLAGAFPPEFKPNAAADWKPLVGKPIPIRNKHGDAESEITLPDAPQPTKIASGSFTIGDVKADPLRISGKIILKWRAAGVDKQADGTFDVGVIRYG